MKKYTFLLLLLCPLFIKAQANYQPGTVTKLNGDVVTGLIDYRQWQNNPASINFKKSKEAPVETYTTDNALAFNLKEFDSDYKKFTVGISLDKTTSPLTTGADTSATKGTVFLKELNSGKNLTLYSYTNNIKTRYYIAETGAQPVELIYRRYIDPLNATRIVIQDNYKQQLTALITRYQPENKRLINDVNNADYTEGNLIKLVIRTNLKPGASIGKSHKNINADFFGGISLNSTLSTVSSPSSSGSSGSTASHSSSFFFPELHFGANVLLNNSLKDFVFRAEATVGYNNASYDVNTNGGGGYTAVNHISIKDVSVGINPQLLYNFKSSTPAKFYVGAGIAAYIVQSGYHNIGYSTYLGTTSLAGTDEDNSSLISAMATFKAGYTVNHRVDIYLGYNVLLGTSNGISILSFGSDPKITDQSVFKLGFNYTLGKK